jgi:hypothetical protein
LAVIAYVFALTIPNVGLQDLMVDPDLIFVTNIYPRECRFLQISHIMADPRSLSQTLERRPTVRDDRWSEAIAVGSLAFVESIKSDLSGRATHRAVEQKEAPGISKNETVMANAPLPRLSRESQRWVLQRYSFGYEHITEEWVDQMMRLVALPKYQRT